MYKPRQSFGAPTEKLLKRFWPIGYSVFVTDDGHGMVAVNRATNERVRRTGDNPHEVAYELATAVGLEVDDH